MKYLLCLLIFVPIICLAEDQGVAYCRFEDNMHFKDFSVDNSYYRIILDDGTAVEDVFVYRNITLSDASDLFMKPKIKTYRCAPYGRNFIKIISIEAEE